MAAQSVGKVWMLRHEIQGVPLPDDFAETHPEVTTGSSGVDARGGFGESYPTKDKILTSKVAKAQNQTYWCGPATLQAIGWSSQGKRKTQAYWARRLGTTVRRHRDHRHGARHQPQDRLRRDDRRRALRRARHQRLHLQAVVPRDDAPRHRLPGAGRPPPRAAQAVLPLPRRRRERALPGRPRLRPGPDGNRKIGYFEPWDQSRFDPSEPAIERVQWRNAYKSYRANLDHFQHNLGV